MRIAALALLSSGHGLLTILRIVIILLEYAGDVVKDSSYFLCNSELTLKLFSRCGNL